MSQSKDEKNKKQGCYVVTAFIAFFVAIIFEQFWPDVIPFSLFEFLNFKGSLEEVIKLSWPIFLWGIAVTTIGSVMSRNKPIINRNAEAVLGIGCVISTWAGVVEELAFRWLIFYNEIIGYKILNWLFFGFLGFGIFEWLHLHISAPIANLFTLGALEPVLFGSFGWAVGAALLTSNGKFQDGHEYLGLLGFLNSWFIGMFFFYLMFSHGLFASMLVHFLYDMFIFVVRYIDAAIERKLGWI